MCFSYSSDMMPAVSTEEKTVTCGLATVEESSLNQCEETENTKVLNDVEDYHDKLKAKLSSVSPNL